MFGRRTLAVRDVAATMRFFEETLGWRSIRQPDNIEITAAWLEIAPGQQLHLLRIPDFAPSAFEAEFGRHFAFFYPGRQFDALKQRLVAAGATIVDAIRPTPFARFFFRDPNGYYFEIIDADGYSAETT